MLELLRKRETPFEANANEELSTEQSEIVLKGDLTRFNISDESVATLKANGYAHLFPIQQATYEDIFEGNDVIGKDRTGSGKTLAFALPVLERLRKSQKCFKDKKGQKPTVMVLVPTRELAIQVGKEFEKLKNSRDEYRVLTVYGGTDINEQMFKLRAGVEIIVGTPGRIIDLRDRKELSMSRIKVVVLDETDQMLSFGFQEDIEKIFNGVKIDITKKNRQIEDIQFLLFSATVPKWVDVVAATFMKKNLVRVDMIKDSEVKTSVTVDHYCILCAREEEKFSVIPDIIRVYGGSNCRNIVFTNTKEEANYIGERLQTKHNSRVLHGDIPQVQREEIFKGFRAGTVNSIVATNVAARGLDIPEVDLIIQISPPKDIDDYIHRSGRTGRAGKKGTCITLYTVFQKELIDRIEYRAGIQMMSVGLPKSEDLMRASLREISNSFSNVSQEALAIFNEPVESLLMNFEPKEALSRALALLAAQSSKTENKSLLLQAEGYITYVIEIDKEVEVISYFWNILKNSFSPEIFNSIRGMKTFANKRGVVFDVNEKYSDEFDKGILNFSNKAIRIYKAKILPELSFGNQKNLGLNRGSNNRDGDNKQKSPFGQKNTRNCSKFGRQLLPRQQKSFIAPSNNQPNFVSNRGHNIETNSGYCDTQKEFCNESKTTHNTDNRGMSFNGFMQPQVDYLHEDSRFRHNRFYISDKGYSNSHADLGYNMPQFDNSYNKLQNARVMPNAFARDNFVPNKVQTEVLQYKEGNYPQNVKVEYMGDYRRNVDLSDNISDNFRRNSDLNHLQRLRKEENRINFEQSRYNERNAEMKIQSIDRTKMEVQKPLKMDYVKPKYEEISQKREHDNHNEKYKDRTDQKSRDRYKHKSRHNSEHPRGEKSSHRIKDDSRDRRDRKHGDSTHDRDYRRKASDDRDGKRNDRENNRESRREKEKTFDEGEIDQKDLVDSTKLFVSNLGLDISDRDIQHYLSKKGLKADDLFLVKNKEGTSKGFGYATFRDARTAQKAFHELTDGRINGKNMRVCYAMKKKAN